MGAEAVAQALVSALARPAAAWPWKLNSEQRSDEAAPLIQGPSLETTTIRKWIPEGAPPSSSSLGVPLPLLSPPPAYAHF